MSRVYIAGPMTGYHRFNFDAFESACTLLRAEGYEVTSPHEMDLNNGFDPDSDGAALDLLAALEEDLAALVTCDAVVLLPHWEDSPGAAIEVVVAGAHGIPCVLLADLVTASA